MSLGSEYLESAIARLNSYKDLAEKTFLQLKAVDFDYLPNESSNSIALIIQHMSGNMLSRWTHFLTEDGEKTWRDRDDEFESHEYNREQLMDLWERGWTCTLNALNALREEDLLKTIHIRKEALSALDAINRQLAHYAYHVGQIVYIGKLLKDRDWETLTIPKANRSRLRNS
ncbi:MAG: DUF1572 family protein [Chitinophagales bacterium]